MRRGTRARRIAWLALPLALGGALLLRAAHPRPARAEEQGPAPVSKASVYFDDGDTIVIRWPAGAGGAPPAREESVRLLGIDAPEVLHLDHHIPYAQPFGEEAAGFLAGCLAVAERVELLRSGQTDPFGRTLAYLLLDGKNYSVLALEARLAVENVSRYGDNGLPAQAQACLQAAKRAGPVAFEDPHLYRQRMREVSKWLRARGLYPRGPETGAR